jgi:Ni/Fe-hydrogenase subunit HybB-like protein
MKVEPGATAVIEETALTGLPRERAAAGVLGGPLYEREPLVCAGKNYQQVTEDVVRWSDRYPTRLWWIAISISGTLFLLYLIAMGATVGLGTGLLGINHPVGWGSFIINFVFWIGIGHAGTLISAILYLFRQKWRTGINRTAEAMTIFAVLVAGTFPLLHTGRPWFAYWLTPIPNGRGPIWPNFNSPLAWDVFAVSTYLIISLVFWYMGLLPDFASTRDRARHPWRKFIYNALSLGWNGSNRTWRHYESAYLVLAGLSAPLVLSVHTIVSFDFATAGLPGWHATIFPPYFVIGAIFSGFAMVVTLMVIMRKVFGLENYITINHLEAMNKIIMFTGMVVGFAYSTEFFMAWYSGNPYEGFIFTNRAFGPYSWAYWIMFTCNAFVPQLFWFKRFRRSIPVMFVVVLLVNVGMYFERYVIIVTTLHRDFLPGSWGMYSFTVVDWMILIGSFGMFLTFFLLFTRFFPTVAISEVKGVIPTKQGVVRAADGKGDVEGKEVSHA